MDGSKERAAAYVRVSTDEQTELSPHAQIRAIRSYCEQRQIEMDDCHIYKDEGISGRTAGRRPGFMRMICEAKKTPRPFDLILVHKFDRFSRNKEDSVVYKSMLRKQCGIKVVSVTEQLQDDKFSLILESMLEAMAEYYSLNLSDEVKKGMLEKALRGELQTPAPLGYKMTGGLLVPHESESSLIKLIFEKYANSEMTLSEMASYLNKSGFKTKRGGSFQKRSVKYIILNPVYTGMKRWSPFKDNRKENTEEIIVKGRHPPLIDMNLWHRAKEKALKEHILKKTEKPRDTHFLKGLLKCARCMGNMYLTAMIFRCGNYLNGKCEYPQGISVKGAENKILSEFLSVIAPEAHLQSRENQIRLFVKRVRAVYYDKSNDSFILKE